MMEQKNHSVARYGSWGYFLLIIGLAGLSALLLYINQDVLASAGMSPHTMWAVWAAVFAILLFGLISSPLWWRWKQRKNQQVYKPHLVRKATKSPLLNTFGTGIDLSRLKKHLHSRYHLLWRYKVRLLLVVGDDAARAALVPGLQEQQWLEGQRTVLIDGGSLSAAPDGEKLAALRQLRRGRPLDGIVWVLADGQLMTPQMQDNGLRSLENISQALRWQPPVWLWQLRGSEWPQDGREQQTVGALFSARARPEEVCQQLDSLVPQLREQGMAQIALHLSHDFLLRLGSELEQGESLQWQQRLSGWLTTQQARIPLRGLMFSQPSSSDVATRHDHALILSNGWGGIVAACRRQSGRRVGLPWQQTLAWALMAVIGLWGAGLLLSFALNRSQIVSVAEKARAGAGSGGVRPPAYRPACAAQRRRAA